MQKIIAHRGASGYAPENTLPAFSLAAQQGADGVELDVHLSRDGEIVVIHDETIDRVSDGSGRVMDMTVGELKRFSCGKVHPEYQNVSIPTLRDVFELLLPTGLMVNVELKNSVLDYPGLEQACVNLAAEMGMTERVLYSSFNHYSLLRLKNIDPSVRCGMLYAATLVRPWAYAVALGLDALHPFMDELLVPNECRDAHAAGILVHPWTVNKEDELKLAFLAGADAVITNYPDRARKVLESLVK